MNVLCIFPIANCHKQLPEIIDCFEAKIVAKLLPLGAALELKYPNADYKYVKVGERISKPKGEGIIDCIKGAVPEPDYVLVCDGSGAIPYENIVELFQALVSDQSVHCAMIERIGQNKAISKERYLIERFEIFVLKNFFEHKKEIADGQGGLWGFYKNEINKNGTKVRINLTAKEYDIELDLLSEVLEKKLGYLFVPIALPERKASSNFTYSNNLKKMDFLLNKYPKIKNNLPNYLENYSLRAKQEIDNLAENEKTVWENYKKDVLILAKKNQLLNRTFKHRQ